MTKPWEEEWEVLQSTVVVKGTNEVAFRRMDRLVMAAAAPDMAKTLLAELGETGHKNDCVGLPHMCNSPRCHRIRAALAKAGVPLP